MKPHRGEVLHAFSPQNLTARDPLRLKITRTDNLFMSSPRNKHHFGAIFGKTSPQTRKTRALALPGRSRVVPPYD